MKYKILELMRYLSRSDGLTQSQLRKVYGMNITTIWASINFLVKNDLVEIIEFKPEKTKKVKKYKLNSEGEIYLQELERFNEIIK